MDLSIIIPNFNSGELLKNTLKSIFESEANFQFEVLIIDNLSTDNPEEIVKSFLAEKITFISEKDEGIYDAMNKGIRKAKGNWLYFLGSGDEFLVQNVNRLQFANLKAKMIYGNVVLLQKNRIYDGEFSLFKLMKRNICHQAIFYHKSIFQDFGNFDLRFKVASDYVYNLLLFLKIRKYIKYYPITICNFLGLGVSDKVRDDLFQDKKFIIINKMCLQSLKISNLFSLLQYNTYFLKKYIKYKFG